MRKVISSIIALLSFNSSVNGNDEKIVKLKKLSENHGFSDFKVKSSQELLDDRCSRYEYLA